MCLRELTAPWSVVISCSARFSFHLYSVTFFWLSTKTTQRDDDDVKHTDVDDDDDDADDHEKYILLHSHTTVKKNNLSLQLIQQFHLQLDDTSTPKHRSARHNRSHKHLTL